MASRVSYNSEDIEALLTSNSKQVIEEFLTYYGERSHANMRSSVYRLLYLDLSKEEVSDINYQDYLRLFPNDDKGTNTQEKYRYSFFRFLYAFDYLKVSDGFEERFIKSRERSSFVKITDREVSIENKEKQRNTLNIEELTSIQQIINLESTKLDTLKMQFVWFAAFELGLEIDEIKRNISSDNYSDGELYLKEVSYKLPKKYCYMFEKINEDIGINNGFSAINSYFEKLGNLANLEKKLLPRTAKATRKNYMVTCGNCEDEYTNLSYNWLSINGRIICVECAEALKKKLNFEIEVIPIENVDIKNIKEEELTSLLTYEDLKAEIEKAPIDFLKLHELQIQIGKLGETFVYEYECERLKNTKYIESIDVTKALDPKNGYDILSYTEEGLPLHIEVKTTTGKEDTFYISSNEYKTAEDMSEKGLKYVVYFVKEIMSKNPIVTKIWDITKNDSYEFVETSWQVTKAK